MEAYSVVGKRLPRIDGGIKATGVAKFTTDMALPGMLYGKILRSPYPHARIVIGVRIKKLPLTPEKILEALEEKVVRQERR